MEGPSCQGCRERDAEVASLRAEVAQLRALVADLTRKLQDKDLPKTGDGAPMEKGPLKQKRDKGRRRPGGQPGHPARLRQLLPPERVTKTVPFVPKTCGSCGAALPKAGSPDDPPPTRFQVAELPKVRADITEYQGHSRTCPCCGERTTAAIPAEIRGSMIGPGLAGLMGYLVGVCGLSKRRVEETVESIFEVPVSLGTICSIEQEISGALEAPHQEVLDHIRDAPVKHADETGWKKAGKKRWLWVVATSTAVGFVIHRLRSAAVAMQLLGPNLKGVLCSDRWTAYDWAPPLRRQICWAHLKRNFEKMQERGGAAATIAKEALESISRLFELWHLFRGGGITRDELGNRAAGITLAFMAMLERGEKSRDARTARFCARLRSLNLAMWTFIVEEGVEPTNNHGERVQRLAVLYRKNCFGCHSDAGCRFVERLLTAVQTLRLQRRPVLDYLRRAIDTKRSGHKAPSLLSA
jgi:transposase